MSDRQLKIIIALIYGSFLYYAIFNPKILLEGFIGLVVWWVFGLALFILPLYYIVKRKPWKTYDLLVSVLIIVSLGPFILIGSRLLYNTSYDIIYDNKTMYTGEIKVDSRRSGRYGRSRSIILIEDNRKSIPISYITYREIKDSKYAQVIYYKKSEILKDVFDLDSY